jgi:hypothetical protein
MAKCGKKSQQKVKRAMHEMKEANSKTANQAKQ